MNCMFEDCNSLTSVDVSSFNTESVIDMEFMFANCNLTKIDLKNFNTNRVEKMFGMFLYNKYLTSLDLSSFRTDKLETVAFLVSGCSSLTSIDLYNFDFEKIKSQNNMFHKSDNLKYVRNSKCIFGYLGKKYPNFTCIKN